MDEKNSIQPMVAKDPNLKQEKEEQEKQNNLSPYCLCSVIRVEKGAENFR